MARTFFLTSVRLPNRTGWDELQAAESKSGVDVFSNKGVNAADPTELDGAGDALPLERISVVHQPWHAGFGGCYSEREVSSPYTTATLYRRRIMLKAGGFDEDYFCYVEDVDLGFRLRLAGYRCINVPLSVVYHVGASTTGGQHSDFAMYHGHRNLVWTFAKDMPGTLFWLLLPLHVLLNLVSIIWFALLDEVE